MSKKKSLKNQTKYGEFCCWFLVLLLHINFDNAVKIGCFFVALLSIEFLALYKKQELNSKLKTNILYPLLGFCHVYPDP